MDQDTLDLLSDDELAARLRQRGLTAEVVVHLVKHREASRVNARLREELD